MTWTPLPTQYVDIAAIKLPAWVPVTDAGADPALLQAIRDATAWIQHATGRAWVQPTAQTLTYDAPLSTRLLTADLADVVGIVVKVNGVTLDPSAYEWLWRTIDRLYPHAYGLRLLSGLWADSANTAGRDVTGDVTLTGAKPCTTLMPPDLIAQAVIRQAIEYYVAGNSVYQGSAGDTESGLQPAPAITRAEVALGSYIHPSRKIGRP